jgi:hypothetical protein
MTRPGGAQRPRERIRESSRAAISRLSNRPGCTGTILILHQ